MWDIVWVSPQGHRSVWSPPVGTYGIHSVVWVSPQGHRSVWSPPVGTYGQYGIHSVVWVSPQGHRSVWSPPVGTYGIHSVVGTSNFAKYREIRPVTVWEILINLLKPAIPQWWEKWESDWNLYPGTNHHQKLIVYRESPLVHAYHVWSTSISAIMSYPAYRIWGLFRRVPKCIQYKLCILVHSCLNGVALQYLSELIQSLSEIDSHRQLRLKFWWPATRHSAIGDSALAAAGPRAWNNLPVDLRLSESFSTFKTHLKSHLFNISFPSVWLYHNYFLYRPIEAACVAYVSLNLSLLH